MQTQKTLTCASLEEQYQLLQDTADNYQAVLMSAGYDAEETKKMRTAFDTATEQLRENILLYKKEQQEGIFYLSSEYQSGEEYIEALREKGYRVHPTAEYLLRQLNAIPEEKVRLRKMTRKDLGLPDDDTIEDVLKAAKAQGLQLCPPWVGPQYRMQCPDDEQVVIGMEPMANSDGVASVFDVYRDDRDRCWLYGYPVHYEWASADGGWVFVSPASST